MRLAATLALVATLSVACSGAQIPPDAMIMSHSGSIVLPEGFDPGGVAVAPDDRMLVWDTGEPRAIVIDSAATLTTVALPWHLAFAKVWWSELARTWRGFSSAHPSIVEMTTEFRFLSSVDLGDWADSVEILDVTEVAGQFWIAYRGGPGDVHISQVTRSGGRLPSVLTLEAHSVDLDTAARISVHLSVSGESLVVNQLWPPYNAVQLVAGAEKSRWDVLAQLATGPRLRSDVKRSLATQPWAALPIVPLDSGWLLTIADLRGDRRVLARFDHNGTLMAAATLDAAIGFVGSVVERCTLVAMERDLAGATIHWYTWRWAPPS